ncbi:MAG: hypothetical protein AB8B96_09130 [Lysobacterales bacterium]
MQAANRQIETAQQAEARQPGPSLVRAAVSAPGKPRKASQSIIGKTVSGVITRPSNGGREHLLVLQFSDGSCFEFVSPASARTLRSTGAPQRTAQSSSVAAAELEQLSFFPHDGNAQIPSTPVF